MEKSKETSLVLRDFCRHAVEKARLAYLAPRRTSQVMSGGGWGCWQLSPGGLESVRRLPERSWLCCHPLWYHVWRMQRNREFRALPLTEEVGAACMLALWAITEASARVQQLE